MKLKDSFFYTLRENAKDEETKGGNLLVRGGFIKKTSAGIYMLMPLGLRVIKNIEKIVRSEMDKAGANEVLMPCLIPEEIYINSGRRANFGSSMFTLKDRTNRSFALGPTHEELFVMAAREQIKSYKDMPFNIYQVGTKFRDEARPRFGLIRVREFIMKDAYSFDTSLEGLDISYNKMFEAYKNIFDAVKLDYKIVKADTGAMGGLLSEEFQAVSEVGEDILVLCEHCSYASNIEVSECAETKGTNMEDLLPFSLVATPQAGTIKEVATYLNLPEEKFVKTLIYKANNKFYACLVAGDREVNELKLMQLLNADAIELASVSEVETLTHASLGFAGPIDVECSVVADNDIINMKNFIVGANKTDFHYKNVNINDFKIDYKGDIKNVKDGDICPNCGHKLIFKKGIEIGNTFKLGTKYSKALDLKYLDVDNTKKAVVMGCYGIGMGRIMAAVSEQQATDKGINWPSSIAPFQVGIVLINNTDDIQVELANKLYDILNSSGITTLLDDRNERAGVKFNDMELIGLPIRITVGKKALSNIVEFKCYNDEVLEVNISELLPLIKNNL